MSKEFVPYELALELKQLGFDEPCFGYYDMVQEFNFPGCTMHNRNFINLKATMTPLYQQAFRWFREKYQLHSTITSISQESWQWHITKPGESLGKLYDEDFYTYEEAELACLRKLIEIVKEGDNE
jgi:hypothetical protein